MEQPIGREKRWVFFWLLCWLRRRFWRNLSGCWKQRPQPQRTTNLKVVIGGTMDSATMLVVQSLAAKAVPLEADGVTPTPGALVSNESWSVSDLTVVTSTLNADGTVTLTAIAPGSVTVGVSATVTDSDGVVGTFSGTNTVTVTAPPPPTGRTASLGISFGTPS